MSASTNVRNEATVSGATSRLRQVALAAATPIIRFATRSYIAGREVADGMALAAEARNHGFACTLCYWNDGKEDPRHVASQYIAVADALAASELDGCLAIKLPALWDRLDLAAEIVGRARAGGVRVMVDSHAPAQSDDILRLIDEVGPGSIGFALPGRWRRSAADAERAIALGLPVRIVKGQWVDPDAPDIDLRAGYLDLIDRLAGRAAFVSVATHDAGLAETAIARLIKAGTPCEQELLYPDPMTGAVRVAEAAGVPSRIYIPYGDAWLPYSLARAARKPEVLIWFARDLFTSSRFKMPRRAPLQAKNSAPEMTYDN